ncbi:MAG: nucleoside hydrolase [Gemmatimonadaceae bacterium]
MGSRIPNTEHRTPLLIDTDTGIDDAVAIALAARLPALEIVAITTVHGNVDTPHATRNAREVARREGIMVPIVAGAAAPLCRLPRAAPETHGDEGLGYARLGTRPVDEPDRAAEVMAAAARAYPGLVICAIGPLTNLANALRADRSLAAGLGAVFVMGGALAVRGTQTRWSEFNWWSDPEAADAVLRAGLDVRLVPLDVTRRIAVPGEAIRALTAAGVQDERARFWSDALRFYAEFHQSYESFDGCVINDPLAVALAADASLATWEPRAISVSLTDDDRRGAVILNGHDSVTIPVATAVRAPDVLRLIERAVFAEWLSGDLQAGAAHADRWLDEHPLEDT